MELVLAHPQKLKSFAFLSPGLGRTDKRCSLVSEGKLLQIQFTFRDTGKEHGEQDVRGKHLDWVPEKTGAES